MKKYQFTSKIVNESSSLGWNNRIFVPIEIAEKLIASASKKNAKRVICNIEKIVEYHCALTPDGNGNYYLMINKEHRKVIEKLQKTELEIELINDTSKYGIALPAEMETLLEQDDIGRQFFEKLTPGKQRSILHIVGKPKSEAIRIKKAITALDYLVSVQGKLDFKELNDAFKKANEL
ncbi:MAG: DUF1905 domain-containing protein [Chitinophagales bacterium]